MPSPPSLQIASHQGPLSKSTPHLMPFHIAYSGSAPISTYFRIREVSEPSYGRDIGSPSTSLTTDALEASTDSQETLVASNDPATTTSSTDTMGASMDSSTSIPERRHYAAAFRGRTMNGVVVDLPSGYAGVILRAPDEYTAKGVASTSSTRKDVGAHPRSNTRSTRQSKAARDISEDDEDMDSANAGGDSFEDGPTRILHPVSTFSSFVLWHPDIPVDEGRDEYLRSLTEWTRLAAEVHRVEEC